RGSYSGGDNTPLKKRKLRSRADGQGESGESSGQVPVMPPHNSSDDDGYNGNPVEVKQTYGEPGNQPEANYGENVQERVTPLLSCTSYEMNPYEKAINLHKGVSVLRVCLLLCSFVTW
ncbi:hypothetical protein Ciccas_013641, partial [Cichlidogyrus casuarinus]